LTSGNGAIASATDTVAIVTGGSCGVGRAIVRKLAGRGYAIVVVHRDDHGRAEAAVEEILAACGAAVAVRADLTDDLDVERLFAETIAVFGGVDVVAHTTMCGASLLYQHAARHLRHGAAIVTVFTAEDITPVLARELRERDITINGLPPGLEPPGAHHDVADLIACLDRWRHRPAD
jgi:3-oxoacyl-[acyl-carrier protein] reductase